MQKSLRRVLEIGLSRNPFGLNDWFAKDVGTAREVLMDPLRIFAQKILPPDVHYIGLEFPTRFNNMEFGDGRRWLERFANASKSALTEYVDLDPLLKERFLLRELDGRKTDYPNTYFDEIHLHYVLTDPSVDFEDRLALLTESKRLLHSNGRIILTGEMYRADHQKREIYNLLKRTEDELSKVELLVDTESTLSSVSVFADAVSNLVTVRKQWEDLRALLVEDAYILIVRGG